MAELNKVDAGLSTGPDGALRAWQARSYDVLSDEIELAFLDDDDNELFFGYFSIPLGTIWTARNVTPPKDEEPASKWILDSVNGANDTCSQCAAPGGLQLYTEANWDRFPIILPNLLKGNLKLNPTVAQPYYAATSHVVDSDALGPFISDLFALTPRTAPAFDGWGRGGSYCFPCLTRFLEAHLWVWWREEWVKSTSRLLYILIILELECVRADGHVAGWTPPEDCWYGWDCRTQMHRRTHAETKNHLCAPNKGDAT